MTKISVAQLFRKSDKMAIVIKQMLPQSTRALPSANRSFISFSTASRSGSATKNNIAAPSSSTITGSVPSSGEQVPSTDTPQTIETAVAPTTQSSQWSTTLAWLDNLWIERTGSGEITKLKEQVSTASFEFDKATRDVGIARRVLEQSLLEYETVSSRHTSLLQKRDEWTPEDATSFATLVNKEVLARQKLDDARTKLQKLEQELSSCQLTYINALRKRYHEEQIWQDKWRIIGTYGTWSLIILNTCVFLASQYIHRVREMERIKAIETLINAKIPAKLVVSKDAPAILSTAEGSTSVISSASEGSSAPRENDAPTIGQVAGEDDNSVVSASDTTAETTVETLDIYEEEPSTPELAPDDLTSSNEGPERERIQQLKMALLRAATRFEVQRKEIWDQAREAISSVHLPSAAIGAATSGVLFCVVLAVGARQQR